MGPAAFVGAWALAGAVTDRAYSPIDDTISRLAAIGADTRPLMTAGFIVFGTAVTAFAIALREVVDGPAWITAAGTGIATLAVAAAPLEHSSFVDGLHALFAGAGYLTLAATPLLAARPLLGRGHRRLGLGAVIAGCVSAAMLVATVAGPATGLFQRLGLTCTDLWLAATGIAIARGSLDRALPAGR